MSPHEVEALSKTLDLPLIVVASKIAPRSDGPLNMLLYYGIR